VTIIIGGFNAKVGNVREWSTVAPHGLGERNDRGDVFVDWCRDNNQVISNTWFQNHKRRVWTWDNHTRTTRKQIDYFTISQRHRNAMHNPMPTLVQTMVVIMYELYLLWQQPK